MCIKVLVVDMNVDALTERIEICKISIVGHISEELLKQYILFFSTESQHELIEKKT